MTAAPVPGFAGDNHLMIELITPDDFIHSDPFILLTDHRLDVGTGTIRAPHPHAGFETVTLFLEGSIRDRSGGNVLGAGDLQWMTAGSGIIHKEDVETMGPVRVLQLRLTLPKAQRWTTPSLEAIRLNSVPIRRMPGVEARLYSGISGNHHSTTRNHVPMTMVDIKMESGASFEQDVPTWYNGFVYVIDGCARLGADGAALRQGQVGWLDRPEEDGPATLPIVSGEEGARLILYAGQPQRESIVVYGPFIGESRDDVVRLYNNYRQGRFQRINHLSRAGSCEE